MGECASSGGSIPGALFARHLADPSGENKSFASADGGLAGVRRGGDGDTAVGDPRGVEQLANICVGLGRGSELAIRAAGFSMPDCCVHCWAHAIDAAATGSETPGAPLPTISTLSVRKGLAPEVVGGLVGLTAPEPIGVLDGCICS